MSDSALKMDALHSSKLLTFSYIITQSHKPEDDSMNLHIQNTSFLTANNEIKVHIKSLTLSLLMSYIYIYIYIYGAPVLDVSRSHTTTQHSR